MVDPYSRSERARSLLLSTEHISDELTQPLVDLLTPLLDQLRYRAERYRQSKEKQQEAEDTLQRLNSIGPRYEQLSKAHKPKTCITMIQAEFGAPEETVHHYIKKHIDLKTDQQRSKRNKLILSMYAAGFSNSEISDQTNLSTKQVSRIISKAKEQRQRHKKKPVIPIEQKSKKIEKHYNRTKHTENQKYKPN